jgi:exodeoxyribonuclease VII large subunit
LQEQAQQLDGLEARLLRGWAAQSAERSNELALLAQSLRAQSPRRRLERLTQDLSGKKQRLSRAAKVALQRKGASLAQLGRNLEAISPLSTLARGYSISFDADGNALRSIEDTAPGKEISTQVGDGRIVSLVKETAKSPE